MTGYWDKVYRGRALHFFPRGLEDEADRVSMCGAHVKRWEPAWRVHDNFDWAFALITQPPCKRCKWAIERLRKVAH